MLHKGFFSVQTSSIQHRFRCKYNLTSKIRLKGIYLNMLFTKKKSVPSLNNFQNARLRGEINTQHTGNQAGITQWAKNLAGKNRLSTFTSDLRVINLFCVSFGFILGKNITHQSSLKQEG